MSSNSEKGAMLDAITRAKQKLMANRTAAAGPKIGGGGSSGTTPMATPLLASVQVPKSYTDRVQKEDAENAGGLGSGTSKLGRTTLTSYVGAKDNRTDFFNTWSRKIQLFIDDPKAQRLEFPPELSSNDRRELHGLADKFNLGHNSQGQGRERRLFLVKDSLHHKAKGGESFQVQSSEIDAIKNNTTNRYNKPRDEVKYADENAERRYNKFNNATNEDSRAVATGFTLEEVMTGNRSVGAASSSATGATQSAWTRALANASGSAPTKKIMKYSEKCSVCGFSAPFEHDVAKWDCNGFCEKCNKDTVWTLEEVKNIVPMERGKRLRDDETDGLAQKASTTLTTPGGNGGATTAEEMTVEEAVNLASMNEMSSGAVQWIQKYASSVSSAGTLAQHLSFVVDFGDCTFFQQKKSMAFFKVTEAESTKKDDKAPPLERSLEILFAVLGLAVIGQQPLLSVMVQHNVHVAFPATPNYGGDTEAVVGLQLLLGSDGNKLAAQAPCVTYAATLGEL